jgi:cell division topological specificity factor
MSIFNLRDLFRPKPSSAVAAKERLQILLAHERGGRDGVDFLPQLQRELLEVIRRYVAIDDQKVSVRLDRDSDISILEVNVELPQRQLAD